MDQNINTREIRDMKKKIQVMKIKEGNGNKKQNWQTG